MFPAETSLIPATIALIRFFTENGFSSFFVNYPYWYLGSTPFKFLIGPVLPILVSLIKLVVPSLSFFNLTIALIFLSFLASFVGWGLLIKKITGNKVFVYLTLFVFLILPGKYITAFALEEATFTISRNLLPFLFLFVFEGKKKLSILFLSLILLINTSILAQVLVGIGAISLTLKAFKKNLSIILYSLLIVTFWYTPRYWMTIFFNPSIGGLTLGKLLIRLFDLVRSVLPILMAFFVVKIGKIKRTNLERFGLIWLGVFTFLTIYRFVSDYDFWSDYVAWLPELEIGFAILAVNYFMLKKYKNILYILPIILIPTIILSKNIPFKTLITNNMPEYMGSITKLSELSNRSNVFLSGSSIFWANAFYNITQVRGGRDQVSLHKTWDKASYELREGNDIDKTSVWVKELSISYILIHTDDSLEYYKDFKNIYKWNKIGEIVWMNGGDLLVKTFK